MGLKLKNNAASSLAASLAAGDTMVSVLEGHGARFPLAVQNVAGAIEYMRVTARAGDVMTVVRGQENTAALDFDAVDLVFLPMTVAALNALGVINEVTISVDDATVTV